MTYKWLQKDGTTPQTGDAGWGLPRGAEPGTWREVEGALAPCKRGLHVMRMRDLAVWISADDLVLYEVEVSGPVVESDGKCVVRRARLLREVGRLTPRLCREFGCDCAERTLLRERAAGREPDPQSWAAVEVSRRYARGEATAEELAAAWAAAGAVAWDTAWAAAGAVAWGAAWGAAGAVIAEAADHQWQGEHLLGTLATQGGTP